MSSRQALCVAALPTILLGCAGLAEQRQATREGIAITYRAPKERLDGMGRVRIQATDERADKDIIGAGARPTLGRSVMAEVVFGPATVPAVSAILGGDVLDAPRVRDADGVARMVAAALAERLRAGGAVVVEDEAAAPAEIRLSLQTFTLDFGWGHWRSRVAYAATVMAHGKPPCRQTIDERVTRWNLYGFGTAQEVLNDAFRAAINDFDIPRCFPPVG